MSKSTWRPIAVLGAVAAVFMGAQVPTFADEKAPSQYELTIGTKTYTITEGRPFTVDGPNGAPVNAVLKPKNEMSFHQYSLAFRYPSAVRVASQNDSGVVTVSLDTTGDYLAVIQVYPGIVSADYVKEELRKTMMSEYKSVGAKYSTQSEGSVQRMMAGKVLTSNKAGFVMAGTKYTDEFYAFAQNNHTYALMIQYSQDELKISEAYTNTILGSLEIYKEVQTQ